MTATLATLLFALATVVSPPSQVVIHTPKNDDGTHVEVSWQKSTDPAVTGYQVYRTRILFGLGKDAKSPDQDPLAWTLLDTVVPDKNTFKDQVPEAAVPYRYAVRAVVQGKDGKTVVGASAPSLSAPATPQEDWFNETHLFILTVVVLLLVLLLFFYERAKRSAKSMYIRRIPGIDAMDEAIGRATEMGRPVLYVPGIDEIQNIQTIASVLILGHVAEMTARYDTEIKVPCCIPLVMVVAEETVRQGYYNAGRPDAHKPQNIRFISSEQFAFAAGTNGIILRDKPAANIYLGRFFAESLLFAETGYVNRSIQIAGTAEITQLPFFIAACDYTLIGEELYAVSAYLSRDPRLLSTLKASDWLKVAIMVLLLVGAVWGSVVGHNIVGEWLIP